MEISDKRTNIIKAKLILRHSNGSVIIELLLCSIITLPLLKTHCVSIFVLL